MTTAELDQSQDTREDTTDETGAVDLSAREAQIRNANTALTEAYSQVRGLMSAISAIQDMLPQEQRVKGIDGAEDTVTFDVTYVPFSHVTKEVRNKMMDRLQDDLESVTDSVKAAFRAVKSVKRSRLSDEQVDKLIMANRFW